VPGWRYQPVPQRVRGRLRPVGQSELAVDGGDMPVYRSGAQHERFGDRFGRHAVRHVAEYLGLAPGQPVGRTGLRRLPDLRESGPYLGQPVAVPGADGQGLGFV
jgi:hypothetical protein